LRSKRIFCTRRPHNDPAVELQRERSSIKRLVSGRRMIVVILGEESHLLREASTDRLIVPIDAQRQGFSQQDRLVSRLGQDGRVLG
jgi:hypothetical protein